jgi:uncharacterized lipoprotein YajG
VGTFVNNLKRSTPSLSLLCALTPLVFLIGCASAPDIPPNSPPTKADIQARDEFARNLPKPPEH